MADFPAELSTGIVHGRFIVAVIDSEDEGQEPDVIPAQGKVAFKASVGYIPVPVATGGPVTVMKGPIMGALDDDGYLCTPHPTTGEPMYRGVRLVSTDDPDMAVTDWTWNADYRLEAVNGNSMQIPAHSFALPSGAELDLTTLVKIPSSPGYGLPQAEAAVLRAEAIAQSIRDDADNGVFNGEAATVEVGAVTSGTTAEVVNVGDEQHAILNITLEKGDKGDTGTGVPDTGDALQVMRMDSDGIATEWVSPTKSIVGLNNVDNTADVDKPVSGPTELALAEKADASMVEAIAPNGGVRAVGQGELIINAADYGAVPSTTVDQSGALQTAANAAKAAGENATLLIPRGRYRIDSGVVVESALEATEATLRYYGTGTALTLGSADSGASTARQVFRAPRVINMTRTTGWDGTTTGIQTNNLNTCEVHVPFVQDFENGLVVWGNNGGHAHTTFMLGSLWENHKNLVIGCTPGGYANQNLFLNGRLQQSTGKGGTIDDLNASQIYMVTENSEGGPNNNLFLNTSIEGANVAYYRVQIAGSYNQFVNVRWESPAGVNPRVRYLASALRNKIVGGYMATKIEEIFEGTNGGGSIDDTEGAFLTSSATSGQVIPHNVYTTINTWGSVVGRRAIMLSDTGEFKPRPGRWMINATVTFAPNDTGRRIARLVHGTSIFEVAEAVGATGSTQRITLRLTGVRWFNGADTLKVECMQTSGGDLALEVATPYVSFRAEYLGY